MKKAFLIPALAAGLLLTACDTPTNQGNNTGNGKYDDLPYSALTPEEQKEKLVEDASAILNQVRGLQDVPAKELIQAFYQCVSNCYEVVYANGYSGPRNAPAPWAPAFYLTMAQMRTAFFDQTGDVAVEDVYGTFTWDAESENFIFEESPTDRVVAVIPSYPNSTRNTGRIEATVSDGTDQWVETSEGNYEIPGRIAVTLYVNDEEAGSVEVNLHGVQWNYGNMDYVYATDIQWGDVADDVSVNVKIADYTITANATVNGNTVNAGFNFSRGSEVIAKAKAGAGNIDWEYEYYPDDEYDETFPIPENAYVNEVQVGSNLAAEAYCSNVKALKEEIDAIDERYEDIRYSGNWSEEQDRAEAEEMVAAYNKYFKATLVSVEDNAKIATIKWGIDTWEDSDWEYDSNGNGYEVIRTRYMEAPFLVFNDDTEILAETYFDEDTFQSTIDEWEDFIRSFDVE